MKWVKIFEWSNQIFASFTFEECLHLTCWAWLGLWDLHCALSQWYRTTLCTTELHCALPACGVHHGAQGGLFKKVNLPYAPWCTMQVGGAQCSFEPLNWWKLMPHKCSCPAQQIDKCFSVLGNGLPRRITSLCHHSSAHLSNDFLSDALWKE